MTENFAKRSPAAHGILGLKHQHILDHLRRLTRDRITLDVHLRSGSHICTYQSSWRLLPAYGACQTQYAPSTTEAVTTQPRFTETYLISFDRTSPSNAWPCDAMEQLFLVKTQQWIDGSCHCSHVGFGQHSALG
ncbi:uncharacterized protein ARMOST_17365 [Armillaria ostoyae]|uniref:Uncharacterized protein n=1 Tax=Armillaria ostoyae TaxID=47428 RepID=A0A284RYS1_ARMOS|nr:uncharacterized protein ARMOST_17365 [Armillaria ostoyae]